MNRIVTAEAPARRSRKSREDRWDDILRAAAEVFHEKGYDGASLQDIADRVGILKGSIYYYIRTKSDLLERLLLDVHEAGLAMVRANAATPGNAFERLAAVVRGYLTFIIRDPVRSAIYVHEIQRLRTEERNRLLRDHTLRSEVEALLLLGQEQGLVRRNIDVRLSAQFMLSGLNSIHQWYRPDPGRPEGALLDQIAAGTLRGVSTAAGFDWVERNLTVA